MNSNNKFLNHYNSELAYLRRAGANFAKEHPKIAENLQLGTEEIEDPHVSRLIEAFAFLTARINQRLDDEFPEICDALLNIMYPHYLATVPSMSIIQVEPKEDLDQAYIIPRFTKLDTKSEFGEACHFRTCYDITLMPITIVKANYKTRPFNVPNNIPSGEAYKAILTLDFKTLTKDVNITIITQKKIRIYLNLAKPNVYDLYQLLFNHLACISITNQNNDQPIKVFDNSILTMVGFGQNETLLEYSENSFSGYRLLTEFFCLPDKFLFIDLDFTKEQAAFAIMEQDLTVNFYFKDSFANLEDQISTNCFLLGCSPIVNLFNYKAEPIVFTRQQSQYPVISDLRKNDTINIYGIKKVVALDQNGTETEIMPFYGLTHCLDLNGDRKQLYWYANKQNIFHKTTPHQDEINISFVEGSTQTLMQDTVISLDLLCSNYDLPIRLPGDSNSSVLEFSNAIAKVKAIKHLLPFTTPKHFAKNDDTKWRLISHLSLNYLSLTNTSSGLATLKEMLTLYNIGEDRSTKALITGISKLKSKQVTSRVVKILGNVLCQGVEIEIEFDPIQYTGMGIFLFSAILEQFFGQYCNINSFTKLVVYVKDQEEELCRWSPRAGMQLLL